MFHSSLPARVSLSSGDCRFYLSISWQTTNHVTSLSASDCSGFAQFSFSNLTWYLGRALPLATPSRKTRAVHNRWHNRPQTLTPPSSPRHVMSNAPQAFAQVNNNSVRITTRVSCEWASDRAMRLIPRLHLGRCATAEPSIMRGLP